MADGQKPHIAPRAMSEAMRRAAILRRYVAIQAPSLEEDERFAAELGLARETLYALARSWRHHADPALLPGAFTRTASADRKLALAATEDPDLSGVNPTRRQVIRERIAELRRFLRIEAPTKADEARSAARLGMEVGAFRRLHRSWTLSRDPAALPGGSTPSRVARRHTPPFAPEVQAIIAEALAELGPETHAMAVYRTVAERSRLAGHRPPSQVSIHYRFLEARAKMPREAREPTIATDHVAIQLPVRGPGGVQFPVLSVIVELASGHILAHDLSLSAPTAAATARLLNGSAVPREGERGNVVLLDLSSPKSAEWDRLLRILKTSRVRLARIKGRALRPGRHLSRMFGDRIGRFNMKPGLTSRPETGYVRKMGRDSVPLALDEALALIDEVMAAHNAEHPLTAKRFVVDPGRSDALATALSSLVLPAQ